MKLWDEMVSYDGNKRFFYLYCCCLAILKIRKEVIMKSDFVTILPSIQKLRDVNLTEVLQISKKLFEKYSKLNVDGLYQSLNKHLQ